MGSLANADWQASCRICVMYHIAAFVMPSLPLSTLTKALMSRLALAQKLLTLHSVTVHTYLG